MSAAVDTGDKELIQFLLNKGAPLTPFIACQNFNEMDRGSEHFAGVLLPYIKLPKGSLQFENLDDQLSDQFGLNYHYFTDAFCRALALKQFEIAQMLADKRNSDSIASPSNYWSRYGEFHENFGGYWSSKFYEPSNRGWIHAKDDNYDDRTLQYLLWVKSIRAILGNLVLTKPEIPYI